MVFVLFEKSVMEHLHRKIALRIFKFRDIFKMHGFVFTYRANTRGLPAVVEL